MNRKLKKAIDDYMKLLRKYYNAKILNAILFGSAARGEYNKESDADILIIVSDSNTKIKDEISMSAYEIMIKNNVVLSPLVMDNSTFDWYKKIKILFTGISVRMALTFGQKHQGAC